MQFNTKKSILSVLIPYLITFNSFAGTCTLDLEDEIYRNTLLADSPVENIKAEGELGFGDLFGSAMFLVGAYSLINTIEHGDVNEILASSTLTIAGGASVISSAIAKTTGSLIAEIVGDSLDGIGFVVGAILNTGTIMELDSKIAELQLSAEASEMLDTYQNAIDSALETIRPNDEYLDLPLEQLVELIINNSDEYVLLQNKQVLDFIQLNTFSSALKIHVEKNKFSSTSLGNMKNDFNDIVESIYDPSDYFLNIQILGQSYFAPGKFIDTVTIHADYTSDSWQSYIQKIEPVIDSSSYILRDKSSEITQKMDITKDLLDEFSLVTSDSERIAYNDKIDKTIGWLYFTKHFITFINNRVEPIEITDNILSTLTLGLWEFFSNDSLPKGLINDLLIMNHINQILEKLSGETSIQEDEGVIFKKIVEFSQIKSIDPDPEKDTGFLERAIKSALKSAQKDVAPFYVKEHINKDYQEKFKNILSDHISVYSEDIKENIARTQSAYMERRKDAMLSTLRYSLYQLALVSKHEHDVITDINNIIDQERNALNPYIVDAKDTKDSLIRVKYNIIKYKENIKSEIIPGTYWTYGKTPRITVYFDTVLEHLDKAYSVVDSFDN